MKMHAKEIIKNKADKMVDLIMDEIGEEGKKFLSASFVDKKSRVKYVMRVEVESGAPEHLVDDTPVPPERAEIQSLTERIVVLEEKEDADTIYDDSGVKARLTILEEKVSDLEARIIALESAPQEAENSQP